MWGSVRSGILRPKFQSVVEFGLNDGFFYSGTEPSMSVEDSLGIQIRER